MSVLSEEEAQQQPMRAKQEVSQRYSNKPPVNGRREPGRPDSSNTPPGG